MYIHIYVRMYASAYMYFICILLIDCTIGEAKDVVFVIDASNYIGSYQFQKIRELVANITITLKLNSPESSVGVILFDNSASILFNLEEHTNLSTLSPAINPGLPYNYDYGYGNDNDRDTAAALDLLLSSAQDGSLGIRNDTSKIAIVITVGQSDSNFSTQAAADALHAANIFDVYAIGFGSADINELNAIASDPNFVYFTYFNSYNVEELRMAITDQLCSGKKCVLKEFLVCAYACTYVSLFVCCMCLCEHFCVLCVSVHFYVYFVLVHVCAFVCSYVYVMRIFVCRAGWY